LLGENDIEAVLQRLDRLTMEESRMTATQTMEVVYGLFNNMKVVMNGRETFALMFSSQFAECFPYRWEGINRPYPGGSWYDKLGSL
jgi:hypothetical protein